jgi:hypothetical protein
VISLTLNIVHALPPKYVAQEVSDSHALTFLSRAG